MSLAAHLCKVWRVRTPRPTQRWLNNAGPCKPDIHYVLPAAARLPEVKHLIEQQAYFVLHAPRQAGKTTLLFELANELTHSGRFAAVVLSCEVGAAFNRKPEKAERAILGAWESSARFWLPPGSRNCSTPGRSS